MDRATNESGADQERLPGIENVYTGIWWASFPHHYAGEGDKATRELGELITEYQIDEIAKALKAIKNDTETLKIQNQYFEEVDRNAKPNR